MANVSFNRGDNTKMDNTPITDGLIFINTEESEIFFDNNDTRISIGGSGGGHVIQNPAGTSMTQEPNMQFKDARITDDSTNEKTVVEVIDEKTLAQFNALPLTGSADGIYAIGDGQGGSGIDASEINYDNTTSGMTATDVQDAIDELNSDIADIGDVVTLFSGDNTTTYNNTGTTITLTDDITKYRFLVFCGGYTSGEYQRFKTMIPTELFRTTSSTNIYWFSADGNYYIANYYYVSNTQVTYSSGTSTTTAFCGGVYGVK